MGVEDSSGEMEKTIDDCCDEDGARGLDPTAALRNERLRQYDDTRRLLRIVS